MPAPAEVALIFDLDNTLIESHIDFLAVRHRLIDVLHAHGLATAQPREELIRLALPELVAVGNLAQPPVGHQMWAIIEEAERRGLQGSRVVAHASDVLAALRARGYRLAVLTNNARAGAEDRLRALDLFVAFDVLATRDDVPDLKPLPAGIHHIIAQLPDVRRAYVVGDAWIDGRAAQGAGTRFIGFGPHEARVRERGIPIWAWITDLRELLGLPLES